MVGTFTIQPTFPYVEHGNGKTTEFYTYSDSTTSKNPTTDTSTANGHSRDTSVSY